MNLPLFIAGRYLFAKKSHNVINVISAISAVGMAIGTAALVLILSVYNGFDRLIEQNVGDLSPDLLMVAPDGSARFVPDSSLTDRMAADPRVKGVLYTLEDNVFLTYGDRQGIARAKGVEDGYEQVSRLGNHIYEGEFGLRKGDRPAAVMGAGLARDLGAHPRFTDQLVLYYPDKDAGFSPSNPAASAHREALALGGLVSISTDADKNLLVIPLYTMQRLTGVGIGEVSGVEVFLHDGSRRAVRRFLKDYGAGCTLLDRYRQQPTLFKMMRYEKAAVYLILIFVVLIVALNIFGSLSMLMIEKKEDIGTLQAMGAGDAMIRKIFVLEGWLISLVGMAAGLVAGLALALLQQHLGLVKIPGNYLVDAYPVMVKPLDILATAVSVALIGLVISLLTARQK
mgnify:CR=1 FL=1